MSIKNSITQSILGTVGQTIPGDVGLPPPPVNTPATGSLTIVGNPYVGEVLTLTNNISDANGVGTFSYQWYSDGAAIPGATANNLTLTQSEYNTQITCTASFTDGDGFNESVTSDPTILITLQRYFSDFDSISNCYIEFDSGVLVNAGDEIEIEFYTTVEQVNYMCLYDGNVGSRIAARTGSNNTQFEFLRLQDSELDGSTVNNGDPFPTDGVLHRLSCIVSDTSTVEFIGSNYPVSRFFNGIIASVKIWSGGDRNTGSLIVDMPINESDLSNSAQVTDYSGQGNHGVAYNFVAGDTELFTFDIANNRWDNGAGTLIGVM